jgi:hypothetical protein
MSSLPPPSKSGVPSSGGNGKYVAIALVLLLGMGGIAFWKLHNQPEAPKPAPTVVATVASSAPTSALIDDVPPPPPIVEAGPEPTNHVSSFAGNPCEVTSCGGSVGSDTEGGLAMLARQTRRKCYEPALANDPTLAGHVKVHLKIASNGTICSASVASNDMASSSVGECAARMLQASGHVPAPKGGCVNVDFPLNYVPAGSH